VWLDEWITVVLSSSSDSLLVVRNHRPFLLPYVGSTDKRAQLTNGPHLSLTVGVDEGCTSFENGAPYAPFPENGASFEKSYLEF
jgi:hypothetical protein